MRIEDLPLKEPVMVDGAATLAEAAELMESENVGALLVMDGERLAGIVTDRDMVVRGVARRLSLDARIDGVMSTDLIVIDAHADAHEAYLVLGKHGIRRLPVLLGHKVIGMVTIDDLLVRMAFDLENLVRPIVGELVFGHHPVPPPAVVK